MTCHQHYAYTIQKCNHFALQHLPTYSNVACTGIGLDCGHDIPHHGGEDPAICSVRRGWRGETMPGSHCHMHLSKTKIDGVTQLQWKP